jgi:hypothetical protein
VSLTVLLFIDVENVLLKKNQLQSIMLSIYNSLLFVLLVSKNMVFQLELIGNRNVLDVESKCVRTVAKTGTSVRLVNSQTIIN